MDARQLRPIASVARWGPSPLPCITDATHGVGVRRPDRRTPLTDPAELVELDRDECLRLMAKNAVGRVVFTDAALPAAQPVNYLLDDEEVVFRTGAGSKLAAATRHVVVAFEIDEIDARPKPGGACWVPERRTRCSTPPGWPSSPSGCPPRGPPAAWTTRSRSPCSA